MAIGLAVKFSRLYQPRNPLFWLLVLLNVLSSAISLVLQKQVLPMTVTLLLAVFVLINIVLGVRIVVQLMKEPAPHAGSRE